MSAETRGPVIERVGLVAVTVQVQQEAGQWIARISSIGRGSLTSQPCASADDAVASVCRLASYPHRLPEYAAPTTYRAERDRPCTCHPDDRPPGPCPRRYAASECQQAAIEP